jgi:hypothetical protein
MRAMLQGVKGVRARFTPFRCAPITHIETLFATLLMPASTVASCAGVRCSWIVCMGARFK